MTSSGDGATTIAPNVVTVGSGIFTSQDGIGWTRWANNFMHAFEGVTYANGLYVSVGGNGQIGMGFDGVNWLSGNGSFGTDLILEVMHANSTFISFGNNGKIAISQDGFNWTLLNSNLTYGIAGIIYTGDLFVIAGTSGYAGVYDPYATLDHVGMPSVTDVGELRCYLRIA